MSIPAKGTAPNSHPTLVVRGACTPAVAHEAVRNRPFELVFAVVAAVAIAAAWGETAMAQTRVDSNRITPSTTSNRPAGPNAPGTAAGRGAAMGDGNALGGQTFRWSRSGGSGRALGSGNALDANSQVGSGRANSTATPTDYNARNLVVTGNVAGGRGFRGAVGYSADTDFRGKTGSDDTFSFEAGSAYSSVVFGSSGMARDRFLVAQGLGAFEYRRPSTPDAITMDQPDSRLRLDRATNALSLGRMNADAGEDRTVATGTDKDQPVRFVVSALRGLQTQRLNDPIVKSGLGLYEQARARQEVSLGLAQPDDFLPRARAIERGMADTQVKPTVIGDATRMQTQIYAPGYLDILESVDLAAKKRSGDETLTFDRVKADLRQRTRGDEKARTGGKIGEGGVKPETKPETRPETKSETKPDSSGTRGLGGLTEAQVPGASPEQLNPPDSRRAEEIERERSRGKLLTVDEMADILRHGRTLSTLSKDDKRRVDELMRLGEASIKSGDYFAAERRFSQAQDYRTGNPLIEVGLAHAQLGGGMYLSSTLTLRNLFRVHPELIDTRYDRALLPTQDRIDGALRIIRERIANGEDRPNYGFLLGYIGHQIGDRALVEEGLKHVQGTEALDVQGALLRGVWLGGK